MGENKILLDDFIEGFLVKNTLFRYLRDAGKIPSGKYVHYLQYYLSEIKQEESEDLSTFVEGEFEKLINEMVNVSAEDRYILSSSLEEEMKQSLEKIIALYHAVYCVEIEERGEKDERLIHIKHILEKLGINVECMEEG